MHSTRLADFWMGGLSNVLKVITMVSYDRLKLRLLAYNEDRNYPAFELLVTLKAHPSRDRQGASNALFRFLAPRDGNIRSPLYWNQPKQRCSVSGEVELGLGGWGVVFLSILVYSEP